MKLEIIFHNGHWLVFSEGKQVYSDYNEHSVPNDLESFIEKFVFKRED